MIRSTFRLMPYINRAKTRADGTTAILLRITIDGKKTVMTKDFSCRLRRERRAHGPVPSGQGRPHR